MYERQLPLELYQSQEQLLDIIQLFHSFSMYIAALALHSTSNKRARIHDLHKMNWMRWRFRRSGSLSTHAKLGDKIRYHELTAKS